MSPKTSSSIHSKEVIEKGGVVTGTDDDFGGPDARQRLERKLLRKLDLRMSILVVIYILNYVRGIAFV